jgi:hypothetical protein
MKRFRQTSMPVRTKVLHLARYHWVLVFLIAGGFAIAFAYSSYNLFHLSMANIGFIRQNGWLAIQEGALVQTLQILGIAGVSLASYMGFKLCENEMISRYKRWSDQ